MSIKFTNPIFFVLFFAFAVGKILFEELSFFDHVLVAVYLLLSLLLWVLKKHLPQKTNTFLIFLQTLLFGYIITPISEQRQNSNTHIKTTDLPKIEYYKGVIISDLEETANTIKTYLTIEKIRNNTGKWVDKKAKILVTFRKSDKDTILQIGKAIIVKGRPQPLHFFKNPFQFDYERYLKTQLGIRFSDFVRPHEYIATNQPAQLPIWQKWRIRCVRALSSHLPKKEAAVATAILLGYKQSLSQETMQVFRDTGTVHLLAISGLHVGILAFFLISIFSLPHKGRYYQILAHLFELAILWMYAGMVGFSASVLRSVLFATIYFIGTRLLSRHQISLLHVLAVTAFFMVAFYQPNMIFSAGFQLSFVAVCSIAIFQPMLLQWVSSRYGFVQKIWELLSVSLAVQVLLFPLLIGYFHQFPLLFWLSSTIVSGLAIPIVGIGFCFFILANAPFLASLTNVFAWCLKIFIQILLLVLEWIQNIPHTLIENIYFSEWEFVMLLLIVIVLSIGATFKSYRWLTAGTLLCILFYSFRIVNDYAHQKQQYFTAFAQKKSALGFVHGKTLTLVADTTILNQPQLMNYILQPYLGHLKIKDVFLSELIGEQKRNTANIKMRALDFGILIQFLGKQYLIISKPIPPISAKNIDVLILQNNAVTNIATIQNIEFEDCILDNSNSKRTIVSLKAQISTDSKPIILLTSNAFHKNLKKFKKKLRSSAALLKKITY